MWRKGPLFQKDAFLLQLLGQLFLQPHEGRTLLRAEKDHIPSFPGKSSQVGKGESKFPAFHPGKGLTGGLFIGLLSQKGQSQMGFFRSFPSGQRVPFLQPLGKILNINQQVLVLAYQYGDGITNSFWPGGALVQLSLCGVDYGSWVKFCWKIYVSMIASAFVLVMIANAIGYGPF